MNYLQYWSEHEINTAIRRKKVLCVAIDFIPKYGRSKKKKKIPSYYHLEQFKF